ncbi:helix-turn-helix domain-containing protein [Chitinophaga sp. Cy-1792]|uniref:helix-turn-helix domain-containing protein n=1 Tax=Chitinophaga sp. Cy-1792 TaxID=2608339 RepID=UPI001420698B|nr:helix-turn-helix transcriptional regulator [Chitinophaga sp. Cy-1792]NIG53877.1 helix-turn-helix transcriptional regulator [Chitinophaga sp. Cy-1792]
MATQIRDNKLLKGIAAVLKDLREVKDVSQEEVYNDTNIHVGRIETAKANPTVSTISALCKYFGLSVSAFYKKVEDHM